MGINGAFLTGDVFNLFVFFEVMLIASYGLMLHGGGPRRLIAGFHYVAINLVGSTLFLFAVGLIYAVTGTLNMADLAVKVPQVARGRRGAAGGRRLCCCWSSPSRRRWCRCTGGCPPPTPRRARPPRRCS